MRNTINLSQLAVGVVKKSMIQQAADVVGSQFYKKEPVLFRLNEDESKETFHKMMSRHYETSSAIYNRITNEIYGCTLACDLVADIEDQTQYPEKIDPICQLMDQIAPMYYEAIGLSQEEVKLNMIHYQLFTGVKPEMRGMRLAQKLLTHNTSLAKIMGFQHIRGDFSSHLSLNVGLKIGYKYLFDIKYAEIEVNAKPKRYWREVPQLFNEERLYVGNIFLDEFQLCLNRDENINGIQGQNLLLH
ncbi:hypothetical protein TTHERM_00126940 (macronuclear) [Tetrahymena thermophila SB210]|uniref:GNAT family acetyltransferase n=1 Tax=Tetrahymena thermophila (strain SB210) TaxID=312017 RepID=I7M1B9_TETTS|nr:hypothetical protein TTHERM_00126940 [Tetrahymena thermophila SB210]EAR96029.1 hypothetical protein TTHERM_00126940 [Tetrahymena thermophila SB210]|eukprot:XP_001016274.1 hypothetical protein TTHERM_00126940 [Tetrahymena thermophila SB210]